MEKNKKIKICCMGDSITYGFPLQDLSNRWSDLVAARTGNEVINCGLNGDSTFGMLVRCQRQVFDRRPDLLVILGGINDIIITGTYRMACGNIISMVKQAQTEEIHVAVGLPLPISPQDMAKPWDPDRDNERSVGECEKYAYWLRCYCGERGIPMVDFRGAFFNEDGSVRRELLADGLHPNAEGHRKMADVLCEFLEELEIQTPIGRDEQGS